MNQKGISSTTIILIIVGVLVIAGGIWVWQSQKEKPVACTQDTKLCPDGSYVSRTGPNCEFAACPEVRDETSGWQTYRNEQYGFEFKYPDPYPEETRVDETGALFYILFFILPEVSIRVSIDSRLPIDVEGRIFIFSEKATINNISFEKIYQLAHTGMGGAETDYFIHAYTTKDNKYIILTLHNFSIGTRKPSTDEALLEMRNKENEYVRIFSQILSTFKFTK